MLLTSLRTFSIKLTHRKVILCQYLHLMTMRRWTTPSGTAAYEKRGIAVDIPVWNSENCVSSVTVVHMLSTCSYPSSSYYRRRGLLKQPEGDRSNRYDRMPG